MRTTLSMKMAAVALAVPGLLVALGSVATAQPAPSPSPGATMSNQSSDAAAGSGGASASNDASASAGSQASGDPSAQAIEGDTSAGIVHEGDNKATVTQQSRSRSGDAVAGAQITGIVAGGGSVSVRNSNTSEDAEATSGDAFATNSASLFVGNRLTGDADCGPGGASISGDTIDACIVHDGDNAADLSQSAVSETGDAVAGGQITGIVTSGEGSVAVENTNSSEDDEATSGNSDAENTAFAEVGNVVEGLVNGGSLGDAASGPGVASITGGLIDAAIVHEDDNELDAEQTAESTTGDAVAGGQVTGAVASGTGDISIANDNTSEDSEATSGDSDSFNDLEGFAGNVVDTPLTPGSASIEADTITADIVHEGDNATDIAQETAAATGDAVAGGQVAGAVASAGSVAIAGSNASEGAEATSGNASSEAFGTATAGNLVDVGAAPASIEAGTITSDIVHEGDNEAALEQSTGSATGDAVAGGQVFGVVGSGGDISVVADNSSEDDEATSGEADSINDGVVLATNATGSTIGPASIDAGTITSGIVHDGDNAADLAQEAGSATGDAVGGGQIVGVVGSGGDVAIDATNDSEDSEATSGDGTANNDGVALAANVFGSTVSPSTASISADTLTAEIVHDGDNDTTLDQVAGSATGDAVAGGSVMGVVAAGGDVAIVADNASEDAQATSGDSTSDNAGVAVAADVYESLIAPTAGAASIEGGVIDADIVHEGDNDSSMSQAVDSASGDAVAGGQVAGVVATAGGDVSLDLSNSSEDAESTSGDADGFNRAFNLAGDVAESTIGAAAIEGDITADIVHDGDNDADTDQDLSVGSGDAVAGGQVVGVVAGGTVDVVQDNTSEDDSSTTGKATGTHDSEEFVGAQDGVAFLATILGLPISVA